MGFKPIRSTRSVLPKKRMLLEDVLISILLQIKYYGQLARSILVKNAKIDISIVF